MDVNKRKESLERLLDSSEEIHDHLQNVESLDDLDGHGSRSVGGFFATQSRIKFLWEEIPEAERSNSIDRRVRESNEDYERIESKSVYRERARAELVSTLDHLPIKTCNFLDMGPIFNEVPDFLSWLDRTRILLEELDDHADLGEEWIRFETLEAVVRCRYEHGVDTILEECPRVERPWYPERFWWRHPTQVKQELEEA